MSTLDLITVVVFAGAVLLALAALVAREWQRQRPASRIRERLQRVSGGVHTATRAKVLAELRRAQTEARRRRHRESLGSLGYYLNRLDTVSGRGGGRRLVLAMGGFALLGLFLLILELVPVSIWTAGLLLVIVPAGVGLAAYRWLVERFRRRFLAQLPDAMDMIVRASRAGIPVTQSIHNVGLQFAEPLGPEFRRMGDNLLLGNDIGDVLDEAVLRVELADFSFFSVCVLLQREAGGSITEALENLAAIIRSRRDLILKSRALTAEGRTAGLILSLLPFIVVGMLYLANSSYIEVLFTTESGRMLLWTAVGMLVVGVLAIRRLSRLRT
ncbi:type II secretion system F family protein [Castellaniella sp. UC4442_H9]